MKKFLVIFIAMLVIAPAFSFALANPVVAAPLDENNAWGGYSGGNINADTLQANTGLGGTDPRVIAAKVINVILGFLGIIAVVLILIGGFMWMTAAGNDDKVATAKKIMTAGIIGLVIVLAAFGIAKFVVNALITATA
ncbi:hypothetical protein A3G56_00930 [Candidatus Falkowbacteria bacterium RIFCSPLOWO2_12_FULL_45_10]|uniref:TrbC/VIRB2 family protein n=1 Tax=Candidatus Falkowbacteria bacterium RIFCSPLOWO2_12_FULL_45_10 TaxID=1797990 RepID=A0A1F5RWR5_9BACT|nr:MAG: hypothetical protein A3G56_00930 [Candidatus Falkowbacteria bacterium RIFCSPLOWO2_12_FULL_45_10]